MDTDSTRECLENPRLQALERTVQVERWEYASTVSIRIPNTRTLRTDSGSNAHGIKNTLQLEQHTSMRMEGLLVDFLDLEPLNSFYKGIGLREHKW